MKQPIKGEGKIKRKKPSSYVKRNPFQSRNKSNKQYGTSKLEADFAHEYLDKLGIKYIYQYEAKDIGRYFDFAITCHNNTQFIYEEKDGIKSIRQEKQYFPMAFLIEIDGGYYHSDPRVIGEKKLSPMQKHNKFIDSLKDKWAAMHCIPLLRIWEYDIRNDKAKVIEMLSNYIDVGNKKKKIEENRKRPH